MEQLAIILQTKQFQSKETLKKQLADMGVAAGDAIMVHASLKSMGWIAGGPQAVVEALMETVTPQGTIVMPSQSADFSEPSYWMLPPVPEEWHQSIRDQWPAYDPDLTPLREMGKIAECFHRHPQTIRSSHPAHSLMAWGRYAKEWMSEHPLEDSFGPGSPLGRMMDADVKILLIGVGFDSCTAMHYAEYVQKRKTWSEQGAAIIEDGRRIWKTYQCLDMDSDRFPEIVLEYPGDIFIGKLGQAETKLVHMEPLVSFAVRWLDAHPQKEE